MSLKSSALRIDQFTIAVARDGGKSTKSGAYTKARAPRSTHVHARSSPNG
jgi:hypothetical protein